MLRSSLLIALCGGLVVALPGCGGETGTSDPFGNVSLLKAGVSHGPVSAEIRTCTGSGTGEINCQWGQVGSGTGVASMKMFFRMDYTSLPDGTILLRGADYDVLNARFTTVAGTTFDSGTDAMAGGPSIKIGPAAPGSPALSRSATLVGDVVTVPAIASDAFTMMFKMAVTDLPAGR